MFILVLFGDKNFLLNFASRSTKDAYKITKKELKSKI